MARLVGGDFSEKRPKASFSDVSREWFQRISHELWQQHRTLDRAHPLYPRGLTEAVGFGNGYRFPKPDIPLVVKVEEWDEALPHFLSLNFISDRIKDAGTLH